MILLENSSPSELSGWYWLCLAVTAVSAVTSFGFSLAALRVKGEGGQRSIARYAASRSTALVAGVIVALTLGSPAATFALAVVMTVVQALDAVVGAMERDSMKTWGPAALAAFTLASAILLLVQQPL